MVIGCATAEDDYRDEMPFVYTDSDTADTAQTDTAVSFGQEWSVEVPLSPDEPNLIATSSRIFLPSCLEVKMVLVFEAHVDGAVEYEDVEWRNSALAHQYALVRVEMNDGSPYAVASLYPEQAAKRLVRILSAFAAMTGHEELDTCKLALWGHSGGSHLMTPVAAILSDRTAAYVAYKGGVVVYNNQLIQKQYLTDEKFLRIPGLIVVASNEPDFLKDAAYVLYNEGRSRGAPMMLAIEKNGQHIGVGSTNDIMIPFIETIVSGDSFSGISPIGAASMPPPPQDEWLGQLTIHREAGRFAGFSTDVIDTAEIAPKGSTLVGPWPPLWIPSCTLAQIWQGYEVGLIL